MDKLSQSRAAVMVSKTVVAVTFIVETYLNAVTPIASNDQVSPELRKANEGEPLKVGLFVDYRVVIWYKKCPGL